MAVQPAPGTDLSNPAKQNDWALANGYQGWSDYQDHARQNGGGNNDPLSLARAAQQMQIEANQPAIATLNNQKTDLDSKYSDLLDLIKASEQPALNGVIGATNSELGKRGITGDSGIAQNAIAQAQIPISTQFGQLEASTGLSRQQDLGNLASTIAGLQAGNVSNALTFSSGISGQQEALQAAQLAANAQIQASKNAANPTNYVVPAGGNLVNGATGAITSPGSFTPTPLQNITNNPPALKPAATVTTPTQSLNSFVKPISPAISSLPLSFGGSGASSAMLR